MSRLIRQGGPPLYRQLSSVIEARIKSGEYPPNERLPTEGELAAEHGVNRVTVRGALAELARRGVIQTQHGRGSFPVSPRIRYELAAADDSSVTRALERQGLTVHNVLIDSDDIDDRDIAGELDAGRARVRRVALLRVVDDVPWTVSHTYLVPARFRGLERHWPSPEGDASLFQVLSEHYGVRLKRKYRTYWSEAASPEHAELLGVPTGFPILGSRGLDTTDAGDPAIFVVAHARGDRVQATAYFQ